jgi:hypothetical protein
MCIKLKLIKRCKECGKSRRNATNRFGLCTHCNTDRFMNTKKAKIYYFKYRIHHKNENKKQTEEGDSNNLHNNNTIGCIA